MRRRKVSDYYWKQFARIRQAQQGFNENSIEYIKLNKAGWEVISKYLDALLGEGWGRV